MSAPENLRLAFRFARRELRSGLAGFRIFLASLTLGVAAIAGVGSLGQAFLTGLEEQGRTLLGGDVGLQRLYPADEKERAFMAGFGEVSEFASLRSMATEPADPTTRALIELKAVDAAYPLVGEMSLEPALPIAAALACDEKACGAVVEEALLTRLNTKLGNTIRIGDGSFTIRARIISEPDRVVGGFTLGPHVMISREGLVRSGLVTPGSLMNYSYRIAFAGETTPEAFRTAETSALPQSSFEITDRTNAIPRVTRFVEQATMFLSLVALTALVVGGVGAGQSVDAFLQRRRSTIATLKAMGASGGQIFLIYLVQIMTVAALALVLGLALGAVLPFFVEYYFGADIPAPAHYGVYAGPLFLAAAFGTLAALGFAIPPLARAREIAPAGLFRDLVAPARLRGRLGYRVMAAAAFLGIGVLSVLLSPNPRFTLGFLGGTAGALIGLRLVAHGLKLGLNALPRRRSQTLRLALANLVRPGAPTVSILVALGLGLSLLATVVLIQASVEGEVEDQLPSRMPSFYFADVQQDEVEPLTKLLAGYPDTKDFTATPMLRGRIVKLKDVAAKDAKVEADSRWAINGDRNVTYASEAPKDARVVEGPNWWPKDYQGPTLVSFDSKLAHGMGLKLGDTITINVQGRDLELKIFNLRDIDFRTGGVNYILILSPGVIDKAPHSYIATVRSPPDTDDPIFAAVSKAFPNITVVGVREALGKVGEMLAALVRGTEIASLVTILAGILVLAGAIAAGHRARLYDAVVLKVLGATRARLASVYALEYGLLGVLAGLAAMGAGLLAAWSIAYFVLDIPFILAGKAAAITIVGGAIGTLVLGLAGGFAALSAKPARRLRNP
jgi:putative ABC transport system permease protein